MNQNEPLSKHESLYGNKNSFSQTGDEISLVDLATIIAKRWKALLFTFLVVVALSALYAFVAAKEYVYTSLYSVAEQAPTEDNSEGLLEPTDSVASKIQNIYLAQSAKKVLQEGRVGELPFEIDVSVPGDSLLVMVTSEAEINDVGLVEAIHSNMLDSAKASQEALLERRRKSLVGLLENAQQNLQGYRESSEGDSEMAFRYLALVSEYEADLALLENGEVIQVAQQSLEPASIGRPVIVALGVILGSVLGVIVVFALEFFSVVNKAMKEERRQPNA